MMNIPARFLLPIALLGGTSFAASKPHVIGFGKPISAKWFVGSEESQPIELKVRGFYIDGRLKEFTIGSPHDVTDHFFVVRRAFHFNDALPDDGNNAPKWRWQRGGWLLVDRVTGHISQLTLAEFDPYYSASSWYRDYIAYCGLSDDGKKLYAMVAQLGRKKPVLKKLVNESANSGDDVRTPKGMPDSECTPPSWQRQPARVTFAIRGQSLTYSVRGHDAEVVVAGDDNEGTE